MPITPQEALQRTIEHREIFHDEMLHLMRMIMSGEMSPVMASALITGLRVKKETIGEVTAAAQVSVAAKSSSSMAARSSKAARSARSSAGTRRASGGSPSPPA